MSDQCVDRFPTSIAQVADIRAVKARESRPTGAGFSQNNRRQVSPMAMMAPSIVMTSTTVMTPAVDLDD